MSPQLQTLFVKTIMPIIEKTIPRFVTPLGGEDARDLVQDTLADACFQVDRLEQRGQPVFATSVAHYAVQRARVGRRALSSGRTDVFSPG